MNDHVPVAYKAIRRDGGRRLCTLSCVRAERIIDSLAVGNWR